MQVLYVLLYFYRIFLATTSARFFTGLFKSLILLPSHMHHAFATYIKWVCCAYATIEEYQWINIFFLFQLFIIGVVWSLLWPNIQTNENNPHAAHDL